MKLYAFVQARLSSTRMPRKVLSKLPWSNSESKTLLEHIHSRLCHVLNQDQIVFLIPEDPSESELSKYISTKGWNFFQGSLEDVRDRYYQAAIHYQADVILRLTGDNPFVDIPAIESILEAWNYSYLKNLAMDLCYASPLPLGMGIESFSFRALESGQLSKNYQEVRHKEHVSLHIKENPDQFNIIKIPTGIDSSHLSDIRMTIDEPMDYNTLQTICKLFIKSPFAKDFNNISMDDLTGEYVIGMHRNSSEIFTKNKIVEQVRFPLPPFQSKIPKHITILAGDPQSFGTGHWERCKILSAHLSVEGYSNALEKWNLTTRAKDKNKKNSDSIVNQSTDLIIFDARDNRIDSEIPVLYIDNNLFINSKTTPSIEILPNSKSNSWFRQREILSSSRLIQNFVNSTTTTNHFGKGSEQDATRILVYTGELTTKQIQILDIAIDLNYKNIIVIKVGKHSSKWGIHHERLPKKIWYEMMKEADCVVSYFGQTILEASLLGKKVATFSISDVHETLSILLEEKLKIPYWNNPIDGIRWIGSLKEFKIPSKKIKGNATQIILKEIQSILQNGKKQSNNLFNLISRIKTFFYYSILMVTLFYSTLIQGIEVEGNNYVKLTELSPETRVSVLSLGRDVMNFIRWRNLKIAKIKLAQIKKIHNKNEEYFYLISAISFSERRFEESIKDLLMALEIHPGHDPALFLMGVNYAQLRNWEKSAEYFVQSVRYAPFSPYYQLNCAYSYFILGDIDNTRKHLEISLEQKPNFENAIILSQHIGDTHWTEAFEKIRFISGDTKIFLDKGFPNQEAKEDYVLKRIYSFYPFLR
ncbi:MAG: hypothetical protein JJT78_03380 [Leptospira sp.]|nr:hypothetical protein [Leptospira sp.]